MNYRNFECLAFVLPITMYRFITRAVQKCRKLSIPSHGPMGSWDYMGLSILSHSPMGLSTGCPPVPLQMHVSYCPSHPTVPWDRGTFHGMSTCPSTDACVHPIPRSHGIVGHSTECPPVPLTDT